MGNYLKHAVGAALIFTALFFASYIANAKVSGVCSNCHTMHNSQDGISMKLDSTPSVGVGGSECFDCHAELRPEMLRLD